MNQKRLRLVAIVSLVAFLFATGAGAALPQCAQGYSCSSCCNQSGSEKDSEGRLAPSCSCCSSDGSCHSSEVTDACPSCGGVVADGSCQCKTAKLPTPAKSQLPSCPGPGTCAICMAKTLGDAKTH